MIIDADEVAEVHWWRALDREVQGLLDLRRRTAQAVIDVAEDTRRVAAIRGSDPLDDLCALYERVPSREARAMVGLSLAYLRADTALDPQAMDPPAVHRQGAAQTGDSAS